MKKKQYILMDIDGVICDFTHAFKNAMVRVLGKEYPVDLPHNWDLSISYQLDKGEEEKIWKSEELIEEMKNAPVIQEGRNILDLFLIPFEDTDVEVHYITNRGAHSKETRKEQIFNITSEWLYENDFPSSHNLHSAPSKVEKANEFGANGTNSIAIEDAPDNIIEYVENGIFVFAPIYPYNKDTILEIKKTDKWNLIKELYFQNED